MLKSVKRANVKLRLALILLLYLILATTYSLIVPIGGGADEWAHYWYAQFIAENGRLPLNPVEREAAGYKSDWPPLYHLFAAGLAAWIDTDGPPTFKYRADNIRRQLVPAFGSEAILHTEDELFPWRQEILVWHLGRFLSICFTLGPLLVTYFIALEIFTSSTDSQKQRSSGEETSHISRFTHHVSRFTLAPQILALISVAVLAFNPRFLFTGMLFNYDSLTLLIASLFLWLAIRVAKGHHPHWGFWGLGALAGLALVTKYLTVLLPLEIVVLALSLGTGKQEDRGAEEQRGRRITYHVSRITYHVSRVTCHVSRFLRPVAIHLGQATMAYLFVVSWWFGYLFVNFNEIDAYGPVLGTLAPFIRGDASDRTVEEIFAWLSGGQAPVPAYLEKQSYTAWQIITELPTTFWGNPITRPYPLNWFILTMTVITIMAVIGLVVWWRTSTSAQSHSGLGFKSRSHLLAFLLMLHCALPLPFMFIRLFGARDALEAVQGRHVLFLAGPAVAILLVWGLRVVVSRITYHVSRITYPCPEPCPERSRRGSRRDASRITYHALRFTFYALLGLLLIGTISQLIFMWQIYPPLLPVRTTRYVEQATSPPRKITLPGGAELVGYDISSLLSTSYPPLPTSAPLPLSLKVTLIWQAGREPPPEDYQMALALVDAQGQTQSGWQAYQTQAHYPTRAWEPGDVIRDEGWLPLVNVTAGDYELRLRILGQAGEVVSWQSLMTYTILKDKGGVKLSGGGSHSALEKWLLWQQGEVVNRPPTLREREAAQFTTSNEYDASNLQLVGPDGIPRPPISAGSTWANFIIGPDWPPGDYSIQNEVMLRVSPNGRNFQVPEEMTHQLEANFENQVKLLGYHLPSRRVQPGDGLPITLYWQGLQWLGEDFVIFNRLLDNRQVVWGGYDRLPQENYSTLLWAPGEVVVDGFAVPVAADAPNGVYVLSLGWYRLVDGEARSLLILNPETGEPTEETSVTIGPFKVGGPPPGVTVREAAPQTTINVVLGEQIELLGFDVAGQSASFLEASRNEASTLDFTFYWQTLASPETDYTVFVHVRNAAGEIVAQKDTPPVGGAYLTSLWDAGEIIKDEISVPLENLDPGQYEVVIGMYDFNTGLRLPVNGSPDGTILLQSFEVSE
jgi:hypothetical protein